jgi:hypothetical protein
MPTPQENKKLWDGHLACHFSLITNYPFLAMSISKSEAKQLLERMIFEETSPQDWVQDVWGLSPLLGDSAAKLFEAFEMLIECCPEEKLDNLLQSLYREFLDSE